MPPNAMWWISPFANSQLGGGLRPAPPQTVYGVLNTRNVPPARLVTYTSLVTAPKSMHWPPLPSMTKGTLQPGGPHVTTAVIVTVEPIGLAQPPYGCVLRRWVSHSVSRHVYEETSTVA